MIPKFAAFAVFSLSVLAVSSSPARCAPAPLIAAYSEYHTQSQGSNSADTKKPWQTIDLNATALGPGTLLGWRQWGSHYLETDLVQYDGNQGATSGGDAGGISDLIDYAPPNTFVGSQSDFFADYHDSRTGDDIKDSRNFVFTFDQLMFTVPADTQPKLLRVWTGAYACDAEMEAELLSPQGDILTTYTKTMTRPGPNGDAAAPDFFYGYWRLRYQGTAPGETLRIRWHSFNRTVNNANLFVQAAALTTAPPAPAH